MIKEIFKNYKWYKEEMCIRCFRKQECIELPIVNLKDRAEKRMALAIHLCEDCILNLCAEYIITVIINKEVF